MFDFNILFFEFILKKFIFVFSVGIDILEVFVVVVLLFLEFIVSKIDVDLLKMKIWKYKLIINYWY